MALAKIHRETQITLLLSEEEAYLIQNILYRVGGSPKKSNRKYSDTIIKALNEIGILAAYNGTDGYCFYSGNIMCLTDKSLC
jgi:hypothetical protein